ncbi:family 16 glycosylhydrolase [Agrobacterium vitis]|uniref:1,3-1,4-beta-glycanase n=1 Tax=Agrobacterium vitis TaxID=373 RepID=A0A368NZC3_AGRVI|nr:family 16 glycosylhydrolase [Agrobacterium vitis]KAA3511265.1 1,3-1,4-beta-glycanase [Agrobacterium vitis]KAA3527912.1 1,3-1,4-beta-glycanase [Agrobacterium vitis]MCF1478455.1 family 16 glycosylhydrolase [Agrobacterium vitis]MUZ96616.1 family 16 glycosylhydrolase [Agrobacterium vitis]MVA28531.1 family 16 glycosylhydrolase [Agrobacterium vitis]
MASKYLLNSLGEALYYSGDPTRWYSATGSGLTLNGSSGNDAMYGDSSVNVTMNGGTGDDVYYLYSSINRASESGGAGVDTVNTWMSYTLGDGIENLVVTGDNRYAFGNSLNNIITGGTGIQTIDGYGGNDVLIGGGGADTFVFSSGNGSDRITDFSSDDTVRLQNYDFSDFTEVQSHMTQTGSDVSLDLGNGESILFSDTVISDFTSDQFQLTLDRTNLTQTFSDDFNSLSLHDGTSGTWDTGYSWFASNGGTLVDNSELQWYINPSYEATSSVNPFSISDGVLTITASVASEDIQSQINGYEYTSGMLSTESTFSQTYGYFEIRADMPDDQGAWPAFWLLPADGSWPPELDVVEMRGQNQGEVIVTAHSNETGEQTSDATTVYTDTEGYHTYGVLWTETTLTWYIDDVAVHQTDTPSDMHEPMYMVVNLAVGGMAGTPSSSDFSDGSELKVDYIKAYSLDEYAAATTTTTDHIL